MKSAICYAYGSLVMIVRPLSEDFFALVSSIVKFVRMFFTSCRICEPSLSGSLENRFSEVYFLSRCPNIVINFFNRNYVAKLE